MGVYGRLDALYEGIHTQSGQELIFDGNEFQSLMLKVEFSLAEEELNQRYVLSKGRCALFI